MKPGLIRRAGEFARWAGVLLLAGHLAPLGAADLPESYVTPNGIRIILIRAGSFTMGNERPTDATALGQVFTHGGEDERPVRRVTIAHDFYLSETEVLSSQFTLGYCIAAQGPNGLIHLLNSSTQPPQHWEFNEAWILDPSAGKPADAPAIRADAPVQTSRENHPDGSRKAGWGVRPDASGRLLLHGPENHWYSSGQKEYEADWADGVKTGDETHWDERGRVVWQREHLAGGTNVWTQYWSSGAKRHESTWRGLRCDGPAREWDAAGRLTATHEFRDGVRVR